jgi:hypothetical protein
MTSTIVLFIVIALCSFLFWRLIHKSQTNTAELEKVIGLLQNIDFDLKNIETRTADYRSKKQFRVQAWTSYREKLDFISPDIVAKLREGFYAAEECNTKIASALKSKDLVPLQTLEMEKIREPLALARSELIEWLKVDYELKRHDTGPRGRFKR